MANSKREDILDNISDVYKEAFGFRPRGYGFDTMTLAQLEELYNEWIYRGELNYRIEQKRQALALEQFEERVADLIKMGASNRENAIRWIVDGLDDDYMDGKHVCYLLDVPYSFSAEFEAAIRQINKQKGEVA